MDDQRVQPTMAMVSNDVKQLYAVGHSLKIAVPVVLYLDAVWVVWWSRRCPQIASAILSSPL